MSRFLRNVFFGRTMLMLALFWPAPGLLAQPAHLASIVVEEVSKGSAGKKACFGPGRYPPDLPPARQPWRATSIPGESGGTWTGGPPGPGVGVAVGSWMVGVGVGVAVGPETVGVGVGVTPPPVVSRPILLRTLHPA